MKTEGFLLHWRLPDGRIVSEPLIGWAADKPVNPGMYFPITPSHPDTSVGNYVLAYYGEVGNKRFEPPVWWAITDGMIPYYFKDQDTAIDASGV